MKIPRSGRLLCSAERKELKESLRAGQAMIEADSWRFVSRQVKNRIVAENRAIEKRLIEDKEMRNGGSI